MSKRKTDSSSNTPQRNHEKKKFSFFDYPSLFTGNGGVSDYRILSVNYYESIAIKYATASSGLPFWKLKLNFCPLDVAFQTIIVADTM